MTSFGPGIGRKSFFLMKMMGSIRCLVLLVAWYGMCWSPVGDFPLIFWWVIPMVDRRIGGDSPHTEVHYQTPRNFPWEKKNTEKPANSQTEKKKKLHFH